jgi:ribosomal protein S6--L-glutamate ligase
VKVSFLLDRGTPPRMNPIVAEMCARLEARGVQVLLRFPEHELTRFDRLSIDSDLYVLKSNTNLAFSLATVVDWLHGRLLNRFEACLAARDKVVAAATLAAANIPAPRSFVTGHPAQFAAHLATGPLIVKPYRGAYGRGMAVAERPSDLPAAEEHPEFAFAQDYLKQARTDLKVFVIGDDVFGMRKPFGAESFLDSGRPAVLSAEVESIVRRVGEAFGLELFGVDVAEDEQGAYVFDVNSFPGFRGMPDAAGRLAAYIEQAARRG